MRRERYLTELRSTSAPSKTEMLIYSGTPVYRFDWLSGQEYMLRLSLEPGAVDMTRFLAGAPITVDHIRAAATTVGSIDHARITSEGIVATARRFEDGDAAEVWSKVDTGVLRALSVEAQIMERKDVTPRGAKMKEFLATEWEPQAVSIVAVGADPKAQFLEDQQFQDIWVPEEYRRSTKFDGAHAVDNRQVLTRLLLTRRYA